MEMFEQFGSSGLGFGISQNAGSDAHGGSAPTGYSEQESACYQRLFHLADADGAGAITGSQAADFLRRSGLPEPVLRSIWQIADEHGAGFLAAEGFCIAMRLVAHAQAGQAVSPGLARIEPPRPPEFEGLLDAGRGLQAVSTESSVSSKWDGASSSSASSASRRPPRWTPSKREMRKYASLFLRTDSDGDGFVEAAEAKDLCERSGLGNEALGVAWTHADQDRDGRLSFREFVALVHAVSCCRLGLELPLLEHGLHPELAGALAALRESPQELDAQRSRASSSPSASATSTSPALPELATPSWPSEPGGGASQGAQGLLMPLRSHGEPLKAVEAAKAKEGRSEPSVSSPSIDTSEAGAEERSEPSGCSSSPRSPRFGSERLRAAPELDVAATAGHLRVVFEADRALSRRLRLEVESLEDPLFASRSACSQLRPQVARGREEHRRLAELLRQLDVQLSAGKRRLACLHEERRKMGPEARLGHRGRRHSEESLSFMRQAFEDEARMLEETQHSNRQLGESCEGLESDLAELEKQRREVLEEARRERESFLHEERQVAELRLELQRVRQGGAVELGHMHEEEEWRPSASQTTSPSADSATAQFSSNRSWASSLVGGAAGPLPMGNASRMQSGASAADNPLTRYGV